MCTLMFAEALFKMPRVNLSVHNERVDKENVYTHNVINTIQAKEGIQIWTESSLGTALAT